MPAEHEWKKRDLTLYGKDLDECGRSALINQNFQTCANFGETALFEIALEWLNCRLKASGKEELRCAAGGAQPFPKCVRSLHTSVVQLLFSVSVEAFQVCHAKSSDQVGQKLRSYVSQLAQSSRMSEEALLSLQAVSSRVLKDVKETASINRDNMDAGEEILTSIGEGLHLVDQLSSTLAKVTAKSRSSTALEDALSTLQAATQMYSTDVQSLQSAFEDIEKEIAWTAMESRHLFQNVMVVMYGFTVLLFCSLRVHHGELAARVAIMTLLFISLYFAAEATFLPIGYGIAISALISGIAHYTGLFPGKSQAGVSITVSTTTCTSRMIHPEDEEKQI